MSLLTRHEYSSDSEKRRDFWIGVVGWTVLNLLMAIPYGLVMWGQGQIPPDQETLRSLAADLSLCLGVLPWVVNLAGFIFFGLTRPQIALGGLLALVVAFALAFIVGLCIAVVVAVVCFVLVLTPRR